MESSLFAILGLFTLIVLVIVAALIERVYGPRKG